MNRLTLRVISLGILISFLLSPSMAFGLNFDPNNVISDAVFFKSDDMTSAEIQAFLERKGSGLANYTTTDTDGETRFASEIISHAATQNGINPKVLLVLLQKEQSLIENATPSQYNYDWATGFAICDSCSPADPQVIAYKGFGVQVQKAAWRKKYYTQNPQEFQFRAGESKYVDGLNVIPANLATAALYNYTPHIKGNFSFWKLWTRYFEKFYPDDTLLQAEGLDDIWLIQDGKRKRFSSLGVFLSRFSQKNIITVSLQDLLKYEIESPIKFHQYSLLKSAKGGVFLYMNEKKYAIPSKKIFKSLGYNPEEVIPASEQDLKEIPTIGLISEAAANPIGELMQDTKTGGVYYVQQNIKHPILERTVLSTNFAYQKIRKKTQKTLALFETGDPVLFADGTLVREIGSTTVFIISHGQKRPFVSENIFTTLGYQKERVMETNGKTLALHPFGDAVDLGKEVQEEFSQNMLANAPDISHPIP
ncbi:hypothetical protein HYW94_03870 [Candidatus Uhrbacteria bacterium]|nr:hypothetical protein [Candidatus Uhrbacteria bacterium]